MRATWLADVLRNAGLAVVEEDGWKGRGKEFDAIKGVVCHHTGKGSVAGLRVLIRDGRSDLPGPLSQIFLAEDGTCYVVADGRSNHAGKGKWQGITAGNSNFIGIEAQNAGTADDLWEPAQLIAYEKACAAIAKKAKFDSVMIVGHKEWALPKGRKTDPTFDMVAFREDCDAIIKGKATTESVPRNVPPVRAMLFKGHSGPSVKQLQKALGFTGDDVDGDFGPKTDKAVRAFQKKNKLTVDGKVGPATWAALGVK